MNQPEEPAIGKHELLANMQNDFDNIIEFYERHGYCGGIEDEIKVLNSKVVLLFQCLETCIKLLPEDARIPRKLP